MIARKRIYRMLTFDEQEAKAKELGIDSPTSMMRKGEFMPDYSIRSHYMSNFMTYDETEEETGE